MFPIPWSDPFCSVLPCPPSLPLFFPFFLPSFLPSFPFLSLSLCVFVCFLFLFSGRGTLFVFWKNTCEPLMNFPPCGFKLTGLRVPFLTTPQTQHLRSSPPLFCWRIWPSGWQAALGAFISPELCSSATTSPSRIGAAPVLFLAAFTNVCSLTKILRLSRLTVGRSFGSSLSGNASYQLSQSNSGGICQSWSCNLASHQHCLSLPGASDVAKAMTHMAWKFPSLPLSGWLSMAEMIGRPLLIFLNISAK